MFGHGDLLASGHIGTLYLKDPAALPRDLQQRLADVFAEGQNVPRLISGSPRTALEEVSAGRLVRDFHTALSVLELRVPPLRDRIADLARFVAHFLPGVTVEADALEVLGRHPWTGNLRELADVLTLAANSAREGPVKSDHLPRELRVRAGIEARPSPQQSLALDPLLEAVEKRLILLALQRTNNHQTEAAEVLGVFLRPVVATPRSAWHSRAATAAQAPENGWPGVIAMRSPQIVILESDSWLLKQLRELCEENRWLVKSARSVGSALSLAFRKPTVLLVQFEPGEDRSAPYSLIADVQRLAPDTPVVAIADVKLPDVERSGVDRFVT